MTGSLLEVENLKTTFRTDRGTISPVDGVSFSVKPGKTLAVVGESGCGKSVTALSIMQLIPEATGSVENGKIVYKGQNLLTLNREEMRKVRGNQISMIFQEPMTALNPVFTVGDQVAEVFQIHQGLSRKDSYERAIEMFKFVRIPDPERRINEYPHQMSGGMKQRVMIAMALACKPGLLIADEPTTALDVTIQAQIMKLMNQLKEELGTSIILITHDLGVVAEMADDILIMYAGKAIEKGSVFDIFDHPKHPYTHGLLTSIPKVTDTKDKELATIKGMVPSLYNLPTGCRFKERCPYKIDICDSVQPELQQMSETQSVACHRAKEALWS